jgi:hypothetical protein
MNNTFLENLFKLLTTNKEFPNYQAERRIDIFINYFLAEMLTNYMGKKVEFVCPEFPLKKADNNQSTKLDYLCKTNDEMQGKQLRKLEAELWRAADQLRANSKLTASEYSMPVLGLIFLRHAYNRFQKVKN